MSQKSYEPPTFQYNNIFFSFILAAIVVLLPIYWTNFPIQLSNVSTSMIFNHLVVLFTISLFLERSLDIFLTTWRAAKSEEIFIAIRNQEAVLKKMDDDDGKFSSPSETKQIIHKLQLELSRYKSKTRVIAMWSALISGVIISSCAVRTLYMFIDLAVYEKLSEVHRYLFSLIDIILTGGLIAGGSDNIHKIIDTYRIFMESTAAKAKSH